MARSHEGWTGIFGILLIVVGVAGCGHRSSLLLERQARGPLAEGREIAQRLQWVLEPVTQTKTQDNVEVTVTYASPQYLNVFFSNRQVFGPYAGLDPYFSEQVVFYVKLANHSGKKIRIQPSEFVMLDERGNQYQALSSDYNTALAEAKAPLATMTRGVIDEAHPGYFGIGVPVGTILGKPQQRFALLTMSSLQPGYLHDGVVYDGLVAFWSPHQQTQHLRFVLSNMKTDFDANDWPKTVLEFVFEFAASRR